MRVAYVCADPGVPVFGRKGSSVHVQSVLRALLRRGARVELLACRLGGEPPDDLAGVAVHRLPRAPKGHAADRERASLAANTTLAGALERLHGIDLVYERCSLWSNAALEHARCRRLPAVLEVNAPLVEEQASHRVLVNRAAAERVADRQAATATVLAAVSDGVAAYLRARHPGAASRVHVVPNGVDPDRFGDEGPRPDRTRPFTIGFLGTLKPWHGLPALVEAFATFHERMPGARLLVVGDGPERAALERDLAARGLRGAAELVGSVAPAAVPGLLARMDVSVAPYPALEPFYFSPLKVIESMAAGLVVVASAVGDLPRLIDDGRTGRLVAPGDPGAVAAALEQLATRPDERRRLGSAARAEVLREHTWDAVVERLVGLAGATRPSLIAA